MKILVASAWPYANGSLHIGHLAGLLPADPIARYYRAKGHDVYFVSGSDCYGTPVAIRAKQENKTPEEISDFYHGEFCECFAKLGFSYDRYGKTSSDEHIEFVREFHKKMYESEYVYEKEAPQAFCENCAVALADRFVIGKCPACAKDARGDQCEACGQVLEPENLVEPLCSVCGRTPIFRLTKHLFIAISKFENELSRFVNSREKNNFVNNENPRAVEWRKNALAFSRKYISEGLRDRAVTRDLDWGINVPKSGYEDKRIYIWAENVLGYLSMSKTVAEQRGENITELWDKNNENSRHYYVHGKDNIPFHTIILPSLLLANGGNWKFPDHIISSEYLTIEGQKVSTSRNHAIWLKDIINKYHPDSVRYFILAHGPEKRDADFTWREFVNCHNGELLGAWGNFVNRTLAFVHKYFDGKVPDGKLDCEIHSQILWLYKHAGELIENGNLKEALREIFALARKGNKYFDTHQPWLTRNSDIQHCRGAIFTCVQMIANLSVLLAPFLPFSSRKINCWLGIENNWAMKNISPGSKISPIEILFERLDTKIVEEELRKLKNS
jgi:methionyl-tRNA synthetase